MDSTQAGQVEHAPNLPWLSALHFAALFAVVAGLWIWFSDRVVLLFTQDPMLVAALQTYKGWGFVAFTTVLIYVERAWTIREMRRAYRALSQQASALRRANADLHDRTEELRRANEELAEAQRVAKVGSWSMDLTNQQVTWSAETYRIFGYAPDAFGGESERFNQVIHPEDLELVRQACQEAIDQHIPLDLEHRALHADGTVRVVHERGYATYDDTGKPVQLFGMVQDITERRHSEEQLQQQERLVAIGQMAAGIAHDFNNILAVIMLYTQMLQLNTQCQVKQRHLSTIYQQAVHAANLVEQILDFSRRSSMERIPLNIVPFVKEMVKLWERTLPEHIRIDFASAAQTLTVQADPARLQQALMNIVINARDAMPDGGLLRLELDTLEVQPGTPPPLPNLTPGHWLRLTVSDTGTGIAPDVMSHLFEPFFTTKPPGKGTGLGLSQVYGIIQQFEGHIQVESAIGKGTRFVVYLPLLVQAETQPLSAAALHPPHGQGELILLVEDEAALRDAVKEMLTGLGYQVLTAQNGQEALHLYERHRDEIALVLSDLVMPGMGGVELHRELEQRDPEARLLLVTGYPNIEGLEPGSRVHWVQKPFTVDTLAQRVAEVIRQG